MSVSRQKLGSTFLNPQYEIQRPTLNADSIHVCDCDTISSLGFLCVFLLYPLLLSLGSFKMTISNDEKNDFTQDLQNIGKDAGNRGG